MLPIGCPKIGDGPLETSDMYRRYTPQLYMNYGNNKPGENNDDGFSKHGIDAMGDPLFGQNHQDDSGFATWAAIL